MGNPQKKRRTTGKKALAYRGKGGQNTGNDFLALGLGVVLYLPKTESAELARFGPPFLPKRSCRKKFAGPLFSGRVRPRQSETKNAEKKKELIQNSFRKRSFCKTICGNFLRFYSILKDCFEKRSGTISFFAFSFSAFWVRPRQGTDSSAISGRRLHWRLSTGFFAFSLQVFCVI